MKKKFLYAVFIVCLLCAASWLIACNNEPCKNGHCWDEGVVTTEPTCVTPGVITYTCLTCNAVRKEPIDATGEHQWDYYAYDLDCHYKKCEICGETRAEEHDFGGLSQDSAVDEKLHCVCGIDETVGRFYSYCVNFDCSDGATVLVYTTRDCTGDATATTEAYARDGESGALTKLGNGEVNFEVVAHVGYKIGKVEITNGDEYLEFEDPSKTARENTYRITGITGNDIVVTVTAEIERLDLPVMIINTQNGAPILDKENYVACAVSVDNAEQKYCFNDITAGIRGRGNTTWELSKKPYKIKFDSKIDLFGNGKAKKWTLIANYTDPSLLRNYFAYTIAGENGLLSNVKYTTGVQNVELYLNGEYCGVYLVCEQVEAGSTRVDIDEDMVNSDGSIRVNTGYLLECDNAYTPNEGIEGLDYFIVNGQCYAISSPDVEDAYYIAHKEEFVEFIQGIIQTAVDSLKDLAPTSENFAVLSDLLDIPSFIDGYLIDELTNIADGTFSSFYIYYDSVDGKIHRGPIWDYDASCGNAAYKDPVGYNDPTCLRASQIFWYAGLLRFDEFKQAVTARLGEMSENDAFIDFIDAQYAAIMDNSASFERNFEKWNAVLGQNNLSNWNTQEIISITTWKGQVDYLLNWLKTSYNYLIEVYCNDDRP